MVPIDACFTCKADLELRDGPDIGDEYLEEELAIAEELANAAKVSADEVLDILEEPLSRNDQDRFNEALIKADHTWRNITFGLAAAGVTLGIRNSLLVGEDQVGRTIPIGNPNKQRVMEAMVEQTEFYTNEFFNRVIVPDIQDQINKLLTDVGTFETVSLSDIREKLDQRLKSVPYWRVVANSASSRAYHYGYLKAAQFQGFRGFRFVAVIDKVTSKQCRFLDGKEWWLADAVNIIERVALSKEPDAAKTMTPWLPPDEILSMNNQQLIDAGVVIPPIHGNCRSTIQPF